MGTLGTTADDLERRLTEILKLSAKWNAIILLDEADSFLESRSSTSSLERNAMVSVMLQLVEYFSGILFLTSNRMDSLDPAFQTRITLSLPYHNLTEESRQKIWDNLLHTSGVDDSHKMDTTELAKHPLNGREIKNALRLALSLASEEDRSLCHELLMQTSAMVRPISALEMTENESVADPPPLVLAQPKPSFFWRYVAITLLVLILTLQQSVLMLFFVSNVSEDGLETDKEVVVESMDEEATGEMKNGIFDNPIDVSLPKRKFFGKLVLFWKKSRETWKDLS
jgi:SpoVK/Ycf46/Vps4 family AAA+-type ATPase